MVESRVEGTGRPVDGLENETCFSEAPSVGVGLAVCLRTMGTCSEGVGAAGGATGLKLKTISATVGLGGGSKSSVENSATF